MGEAAVAVRARSVGRWILRGGLLASRARLSDHHVERFRDLPIMLTGDVLVDHRGTRTAVAARKVKRCSSRHTD
jgi:hypothetical protein